MKESTYFIAEYKCGKVNEMKKNNFTDRNRQVVMKWLNRINLFGCGANLAIVNALGKPKGIQSFVPTVFFRIKIDKHKCLGISSQRIH